MSNRRLWAAYDAVDGSIITSKRVESPVINLTGLTSLQMSFLYLMKGQSGFDYGRVWFFDGANWIADTIPPQTTGCSFYSTWTYIVVNLPTFANNNPNFRIGFEWQNNGDGSGSDPSFAIDEIRIANSFASINEEAENLPFSFLISEKTVDFKFAENTGFAINAYDLTGRLVSVLQNESTLQLVSSGIYLINVWVGNKPYMIKVGIP